MPPIFISGLVLLALGLLFGAGLRAPQGRGRWRIASRLLGLLAALALALLANVAVFRNDQHFDLTQEQAFTPAPETLQVLQGLTQDVELVYFYQAQNPAGRAAKQMVEIMAKATPHLKVRTIDPDQQPALANQFGVRMYNAALLMAGGRRIEVISTEDREIALGLLRLLRSDKRPLCFLTGHGEYDIDNFEFHTHFEGSSGHNHDAGGLSVVKMDQHGIGRLRRALDKLGYAVRKLNLATQHGADGPGGASGGASGSASGSTPASTSGSVSGEAPGVPADCAALVEANPRTPMAPPELALLARYLADGGNLLMLLEPDYPVDDGLAALLARAGVRVGDGVVVDPVSHYFTDPQMVAVEKYAQHPAVAGLALSFFPGARPLQVLPAPGVTSLPLWASSAQATLLARTPDDRLDANAQTPAVRPLALVSEGRLDGSGQPFKLVVVGDADFASNSFYPYLANADLVLGLAAWLRGEPRGPALKPPVEVLPLVAMTNRQMQAIFLLCVVGLPGLCALAGVVVWWRRRF